MSSRPRLAQTVRKGIEQELGVRMRGVVPSAPTYSRFQNIPKMAHKRVGPPHEKDVILSFAQRIVTQAEVDTAVQIAKTSGVATIQRRNHRTHNLITVRVKCRKGARIEVRTPVSTRLFAESDNALIYGFIFSYFRGFLLGKNRDHTDCGTGDRCSRCRREHDDDGNTLTLYVCDGKNSAEPCPLDRTVCTDCCKRMVLNTNVDRFQCDFCAWLSLSSTQRLQERERLQTNADEELLRKLAAYDERMPVILRQTIGGESALSKGKKVAQNPNPTTPPTLNSRDSDSDRDRDSSVYGKLVNHASEFTVKQMVFVRRCNKLKRNTDQHVVMYSKGYNSFACNTVEGFIDEYCRLPAEERCWNEIVSHSSFHPMPCRLYFDLEFYEKDIVGGRPRMYKAIQTLHALVQQALHSLDPDKYTKIGDEKEYVLMNADVPGKTSSHMIYPNIVFKDIGSLRWFVCKYLLLKPERRTPFSIKGTLLIVDEVVYKEKRQLLRIYGSRKQGMATNWFTHDTLHHPGLPDGINKELLRKSLISNV